jgi:rubredoxin
MAGCYFFNFFWRILEEMMMNKYECPCGYVYDPVQGDPDNGVAPGTSWNDLPEDWVCPLCGAAQEDFEKLDD